ncbi:MAG: DUF1513 domain-containing protein [Hyphomicrobiaceae bacterium]
MSSMAIDRRMLLAGGAASLVSTPLALPSAGRAQSQMRFAAAARARDGSYQVVLLNAEGAFERIVPLDGRGHDVAVSPDARVAVAVARRPGDFAVVIDLVGDRAPRIFTAPEGRHFYGHGVFSPDGRLLFATENDYEAARGVLGVYDVAAGFRRTGELSTHGVGPHEVLMMPDGKTLCIANGGIETHPDAGRAKLNLDTMQPSLAFIDSQTGDLKAQHALGKALHKLSLRHMCCEASGHVWFGGQWEGNTEATPWLVGRVGIDSPITMPEPRAVSGRDLKGYIGSMASSSDGRIIAASAPRAGRIIYFDAGTATVVGERRLADACGIAPAGDAGMAITTGEGIFEVAAPAGAVDHASRTDGLAFDNHLRRFG